MRQRARRYICLYCKKHKKQSVLLSEAHLHPGMQKQVDALMFTGAAATVEDAQNYYKQVAADYQAELETLEKLSAVRTSAATAATRLSRRRTASALKFICWPNTARRSPRCLPKRP